MTSIQWLALQCIGILILRMAINGVVTFSVLYVAYRLYEARVREIKKKPAED